MEIIFMTPDGEILTQSYTNQLSLKKNLSIIWPLQRNRSKNKRPLN